MPTKVGCVDIPWADGKNSGMDRIKVTVLPRAKDLQSIKGPSQTLDGRPPYWDYAEGRVRRVGKALNDPDEFVFTAVKHDGQPLKQVSDLRTFVDATGKSCKDNIPTATRSNMK